MDKGQRKSVYDCIKSIQSNLTQIPRLEGKSERYLVQVSNSFRDLVELLGFDTKLSAMKPGPCPAGEPKPPYGF